MTVTGDCSYRLYHDLADWWPLISPAREYAQEAAYLAAVLRAAPAGVRDVLDLGSGGGHVAAHLTPEFTMTLIDISADMLRVSRRLNPQCAHRRGDMRTVRLGRSFDAILVHDAVDYVTSRADLRRVMDTAYAHCRPGGIALFVPDHVKDTFLPVTGSGGGSRDTTGRQGTFRERITDPDPADDLIQAEYVFTLREPDGTVTVVREVHDLGAFSRRTWAAQLARAGFRLVADPKALLGQGSRGRPPGRAPSGGPAGRPSGRTMSAGRRPANLFIACRPAA